jgi:lysozyme
VQISEEGIALIKKFEGCRLESYLCSAGVLTIGYGHTREVLEGAQITQGEADEMLWEDIKSFEGYVNDLVFVPLKQCQFDALVCWTFNLGATNLAESTMLKKLNALEYAEVPYQMRRWNRAKGKVLDGLVRRREAESLLFQGKEWHDV